MDDQTRERLRVLEAAATPGPWAATRTGNWSQDNYVMREDHLGVATQYALTWQPADAALIAAVRNALPSLLDDLEAAEAERDALRAAAKLLERFGQERAAIAQAVDALEPPVGFYTPRAMGYRRGRDDAAQIVRTHRPETP